MSRSYILRNLADEKGRPLSNVWCRAYNATTSALAETQYTDSAGTCTFTTLPEDANVNICAVWGNNAKWLYNIYSATQDLLFLSVTDAVIGTCSIGKLTAGNLTVTGTITTGGFTTGATGVTIKSTGINIFGAENALTTRATETGTIQCYVGADGKLYAGAGAVILDSGGVTVKGQKLILQDSSGNLLGYVYATTYGINFNAASGKGVSLARNTEIGNVNYAILSAGRTNPTGATLCALITGDFIDLDANWLILPKIPAANQPGNTEGYLYYDTTNHVIKYHNGTAYKTIAVS